MAAPTQYSRWPQQASGSKGKSTYTTSREMYNLLHSLLIDYRTRLHRRISPQVQTPEPPPGDGGGGRLCMRHGARGHRTRSAPVPADPGPSPSTSPLIHQWPHRPAKEGLRPPHALSGPLTIPRSHSNLRQTADRLGTGMRVTELGTAIEDRTASAPALRFYRNTWPTIHASLSHYKPQTTFSRAACARSLYILRL
jgi:hypothetical protein